MSRALSVASVSSELTVAVEPLPFVNVLLAHIGGAAALFLATTDTTITATAQPTIAAQLHASPSQYLWVSVAYLLAQTVLQPIYGQLADRLGRKPVLIMSIVLFMTGSALTAFAPSPGVLIFARALCGAAAAGIVSSVWVILTEIVVPAKRAAWSTALSLTWCASAVAGPLLGGVFSDSGHSFLSWRVAFLLNVPICVVALAIVLFALRRFNFRTKRSYHTWSALVQHLRHSFDFIGMVLLMGGTTCVLLAFSFSASAGWNNKRSIALVIVGTISLVAAGVYEMRTKREALIPPTLFRSLTACIVLGASFLITFAFNVGTFYLAVYFQACGASPLQAGYFLLPYSLGSSLISIVTAAYIEFAQRGMKTTMPPKAAFVVGLGLAAVGFGLLTMLDIHSSKFERIFFPLVAGLGIGMTFHPPFQILTNAIDPADLASTTGAFFLVRFIATTVGVSTGGVIFTTRLQGTLPPTYSVDDVMSNMTGLVNIPDISTRNAVLAAVTRALSVIWTVCCPMVAVACLAAICIGVTVVRSGQDVAKPHRADTPDSALSMTETVPTVDLEKGTPHGVVPAPLATSSNASA